jgi:hypothetical protein
MTVDAPPGTRGRSCRAAADPTAACYCAELDQIALSKAIGHDPPAAPVQWQIESMKW